MESDKKLNESSTAYINIFFSIPVKRFSRPLKDPQTKKYNDETNSLSLHLHSEIPRSIFFP